MSRNREVFRETRHSANSLKAKSAVISQLDRRPYTAPSSESQLALTTRLAYSKHRSQRCQQSNTQSNNTYVSKNVRFFRSKIAQSRGESDAYHDFYRNAFQKAPKSSSEQACRTQAWKHSQDSTIKQSGSQRDLKSSKLPRSPSQPAEKHLNMKVAKGRNYSIRVPRSDSLVSGMKTKTVMKQNEGNIEEAVVGDEIILKGPQPRASTSTSPMVLNRWWNQVPTQSEAGKRMGESAPGKRALEDVVLVASRWIEGEGECLGEEGGRRWADLVASHRTSKALLAFIDDGGKVPTRRMKEAKSQFRIKTWASPTGGKYAGSILVATQNHTALSVLKGKTPPGIQSSLLPIPAFSDKQVLKSLMSKLLMLDTNAEKGPGQARCARRAEGGGALRLSPRLSHFRPCFSRRGSATLVRIS